MEIPNILPIQQAGQLVGLLSEDILDFVQEAFRLHTNGYPAPHLWSSYSPKNIFLYLSC